MERTSSYMLRPNLRGYGLKSLTDLPLRLVPLPRSKQHSSFLTSLASLLLFLVRSDVTAC